LLPFEDRYTRQRQLSEVGPAGQALIAAHKASICLDPSAPIARLYLERAGVTEIDAKPEHGARQFAASDGFAFDEARCFADGCLRALWEIRSVLGMIGSPQSRSKPAERALDQDEEES
jgi:hypothetical protein